MRNLLVLFVSLFVIGIACSSEDAVDERSTTSDWQNGDQNEEYSQSGDANGSEQNSGNTKNGKTTTTDTTVTTDTTTDTDTDTNTDPDPNALDPLANGDANVVVFRIKAGTANGVWNAMAEPVDVKIGQVLRIKNEDTIAHRIHTGGAPFPHGQNIAADGLQDYAIQSAFDGMLYDHNVGTTAQFWVKSVTP